jgi:protein-S-isoprenylcysteine O-methyltransferase Ste14
MKNWTKKNIFLSSLLTVLGIICFPVNLLVITGVIKPSFNQFAYWIGWIIWLLGMLLVLSPMIMFPRKGSVPRGKAFVHTTKLVNTGIYSLVRHPQYLGGVLAIFITTILWYPHWLFVVLGIFGAVIIFLSSKEED